MRASAVVPVVTLDDAATAVPVTTALLQGGLTVVEITLRTAAGLDALRAAASVPAAIVGAGTVTTAASCERAIDAGARFVVSPGLVPEVVETCHRYGLLALPGIATPTELLHALALRCRAVKLFPASVLGGAAMVRALAALSTGAAFVPTGGITLATAPDYLAIPDVIAVGGTWIVPPNVVRAQAWDEIEERAAACRGLRDDR